MDANKLNEEEGPVRESSSNSTNLDDSSKKINDTKATAITVPAVKSSTTSLGRFISIHLFGSIELGYFKSVNDVYIKYSLVAGPDWILSCGTDVGVTQISRYNNNVVDGQTHSDNNWRNFVWNQPISISYRSYNFYGWPQIVLSVYYFDTFGNDQILGYGSTHLPITNQLPADFKQQVEIYSPQSSSLAKQLLSLLTGKKPELIDSNLFARSDCRKMLQVSRVGQVNLKFNLTTKDVHINGYRT